MGNIESRYHEGTLPSTVPIRGFGRAQFYYLLSFLVLSPPAGCAMCIFDCLPEVWPTELRFIRSAPLCLFTMYTTPWERRFTGRKKTQNNPRILRPVAPFHWVGLWLVAQVNVCPAGILVMFCECQQNLKSWGTQRMERKRFAPQTIYGRIVPGSS
jgi:hypothetical protein